MVVIAGPAEAGWVVVVGKHAAQERRSGLKGVKWAVGPVAERASESVAELPAAVLVAESIAAELIAEGASELVVGLAVVEAFPVGGFAGAAAEAAAGVWASVQEAAQG